MLVLVTAAIYYAFLAVAGLLWMVMKFLFIAAATIGGFLWMTASDMLEKLERRSGGLKGAPPEVAGTSSEGHQSGPRAERTKGA